MLSNLIFSSIIFSIFILFILVGYGYSFFARTKTSIYIDVFIFILTILILIALVISIFFAPKPDTGTAPVSPAPVPVSPVAPISPGPVSPTPAPIKPSPFGTSMNMMTYYQYDPATKNLKRLSLDKIADGKEIIDYYHRNDETLFVLSDGTIVSIYGDKIDKYPTSPPIEKVRVLGSRYVGLSNGKLYFSKDLKNWTMETSYSDVLDFDVPSAQTNLLYLRTPTNNIVIDMKTNNISKEPASKKKYGSRIDSFLKFLADGIYQNDQFFFQDAELGNVDNKDRFYIIPNKTKDKYKIKDIFATDNKAILKIQGDSNMQDTIFIGDELIYR